MELAYYEEERLGGCVRDRKEFAGHVEGREESVL